MMIVQMITIAVVVYIVFQINVSVKQIDGSIHYHLIVVSRDSHWNIEINFWIT